MGKGGTGEGHGGSLSGRPARASVSMDPCAHSFFLGTGMTWPPQCGRLAGWCRRGTSGCGPSMCTSVPPPTGRPTMASPCRRSCWAVSQVQAGLGAGAGRRDGQDPSAIPLHPCPHRQRPRARGLGTAVPVASVP